MSNERILREMLSRRDPEGRYVIPADRRALDHIKQRFGHNLAIEEAGDVVFVKVASRSTAERIARFLLFKGLLRAPR